MAGITLEALAPTNRVQRRPKHKFQMYARPFQIVPFCIAPVLPAESLVSWFMEAREVTAPVKSSLIGWASEWYLFYVKIRDLNERDTLDDLFINPTASVSALNSAQTNAYYHAGGAPNYTKMCLQRVVETWFRDEGEAWNNADIAGYPSAQFRDQGWMDSLIDTTSLSPGAGDPGAASTPEALDRLMDAYEYLRGMSLTQMTFEDYCRTFGINLARELVHKPELLASMKEWQYPSNTIDPSDGSATAAVSWVIKQSGREPKLFKEPGFIFGVHILRPKMYMGRQAGSLAHHLDQGLSWLPAIMSQQPETSLREFTGGDTGNGPLSHDVLNIGPTNGYIVDMRDLFLYGDQFSNMSIDSANFLNRAAVPTAGLVRKYVTETDIDSLFVGTTPQYTFSDGFCSLGIKGSQIDYTGGHQAER